MVKEQKYAMISRICIKEKLMLVAIQFRIGKTGQLRGGNFGYYNSLRTRGYTFAHDRQAVIFMKR